MVLNIFLSNKEMNLPDLCVYPMGTSCCCFFLIQSDYLQGTVEKTQRPSFHVLIRQKKIKANTANCSLNLFQCYSLHDHQAQTVPCLSPSPHPALLFFLDHLTSNSTSRICLPFCLPTRLFFLPPQKTEDTAPHRSIYYESIIQLWVGVHFP